MIYVGWTVLYQNPPLSLIKWIGSTILIRSSNSPFPLFGMLFWGLQVFDICSPGVCTGLNVILRFASAGRRLAWHLCCF
ncbi:hypothetical protein BGX38DRAFT_1327950, partial [Terfezia claveryi]